jgi:hypothetical protein
MKPGKGTKLMNHILMNVITSVTLHIDAKIFETMCIGKLENFESR